MQVADKAIRTALVNNIGVSGLVAQRVYASIAPAAATFPLIVFSLAAGGNDNDTLLQSADLTYNVTAVSPAQAIAANIADAIHSALHEITISIDSPWSVVRCQVTEHYAYVDNVDGTPYFRRGVICRLRISK